MSREPAVPQSKAEIVRCQCLHIREAKGEIGMSVAVDITGHKGATPHHLIAKLARHTAESIGANEAEPVIRGCVAVSVQHREENAVTLKRFYKEKDKIRLQPANPEYPPQFYDDVRIQGKLIGVIRRLD